MARSLVSRTQIVNGKVSPFKVGEPDPSSVPPFGASVGGKFTTPNDSVVLEVYNYTNDLLEVIYRPDAYSINDFEVAIDIEKILEQNKYYSGKYNVRARFLRNYLGAADGAKLKIQEISTDRLEVRLFLISPDIFNSVATNEAELGFAQTFFEIPKNTVLPNLYMYKTVFEGYKVFDYVQDVFTTIDYPHSIIFKLTAPLPLTVQVDDAVWIAQEVSAPASDTITIRPKKPEVNYTYIGPPNFDIVTQNKTNIDTDFKSWDDVLSTNKDTSNAIIEKIFSGSLIEGIRLNVDYKKFDNFIHFGSAEERLRNFKYKMELLEFYDDRIYTLSQSYAINYPASSSLTGSSYYTLNVLDAKNKKSAVLGSLDGYESYLYYQSSSYESSSFGEFYPTTWPKLTNTRPYVNYHTTSSQAIEWFSGIIQSASVYDLNNYKSLRQLIPEHVYDDTSNDQYILFIDMMGHYFDIIRLYIKQLTSINERYESLTEGFAKDLIFTIGQSLGLNMEAGNQLDDLWTYVLGTDKDGSFISPTYGYSTEDKAKEVWKRIITNLPYLLRTRGTARGIRALINCYGIPSTILRVKEFGGPEPDFSTSSQLEYDQYYYGLLVGSGSSQITIPVANYQDSSGATGGYSALELRFRLDTSILTSSLTYDILSGPIAVRVTPASNQVVVGSQTITVPVAEDDTDWWYVLVNAGSKAYVGTNKYGKAIIYSSSASPGSITSPSTGLIPGSSGGTKFYGYVNEFRLWKNNLDLAVFENHVLAPTSFQGSIPADRLVGSTSSFDELKVRHTFGSDSKKYNLATTTSVTSSHPDQTSLKYTTSAVRGASFSGYSLDSASYWSPQLETHYLEFVDGGANRNIGNKVRIEEVITADEQLHREGTIQDSIQDLYPIDSAKVVVAFSPSDEVNEDISEQYGGLNLDDFLGTPGDYYRDEYTELEKLRHNYIKKYQKRNNVQGFVRLTENYDASLFQLIKQFVPERAALQTGLVIESHLLHRNKVKNVRPSFTEHFYTSSLQILRDPDGYIQDMDGEQRESPGYVFDTEIDRPYEPVETDIDLLNGTVDADRIVLPQSNNSYYDGLIPDITTLPQLNYSESAVVEEGVVGANTLPVVSVEDINDNSVFTTENQGTQLRIQQPSEYDYYAWYQTGSGDNDWLYLPSIGADYREAIQPVYYDATPSEVYETYRDRFRGFIDEESMRKVFEAYGGTPTPFFGPFGFTTSPTNPQVDQSISILNVGTTQKPIYGLRRFDFSQDLVWNIYNAFEPSQSLYRVRGKIALSTLTDFEDFTIYQSGSLGQIELFASTPTSTIIGFDFRFISTANHRHIKFQATYGSSLLRTITLLRLKVEKISRARVQDFNLSSIGRRTSYYEGCKMTSEDFNINSPDTIDGGPVVAVNTVSATVQSSSPRGISPNDI